LGKMRKRNSRGLQKLEIEILCKNKSVDEVIASELQEEIRRGGK
jgi:hypothetical protein